MRGAVPYPQYVFMAWLLGKNKDNLTFYLYILVALHLTFAISRSVSMSHGLLIIPITLKCNESKWTWAWWFEMCSSKL